MARSLKTARTRPTGGGTCHLDRPHVPARITQGRIERSVVTAQDHRAVVGDQSPDQLLVIAIVELMLVTARRKISAPSIWAAIWTTAIRIYKYAAGNLLATNRARTI